MSTASQTKKVPKLRFPEFSGEWKVKKLGDFADVSKLAGFEFTKYVEYSDTGSIIGLRGLNIKNNSLDLREVKYIDRSDLTKLSRSKLFVDDLMFTYVGTVGEVALIPEDNKYYLAPNVSRIRVDRDRVSAKFVNAYFQNKKFQKKEIKTLIATSSQPALSMTNIRKFNLALPNFDEQQKIADFLTAVDDRISLLQKKKDLLEKYKKGVMQKIFSQEIRFKDESGKDFPYWRDVKLGDVLKDIGDGGTPSKSNDKYFGGPVNWVVIEDIEDEIWSTKNTLTYEGLKKSSAKLWPINSIILSTGATIGEVGISRVPVATKQGIVGIVADEKKLNYRFLKYWIVLNKNLLLRYAQGSSFKEIRPPEIKKIGTYLPSPLEQQKIADFLTALDKKIEAEEKKLEQAKQFKKGLLQQMFV